MSRQYSQYGYEQSRSRGRMLSGNRDSEYYGGGDPSDRNYQNRSDEQRGGEAPLEWDDRRYGRDFDDYPRQGGRSVYAGSGRNQRFGSEDGNRAGESNYGSSRYGGSEYENDDYSRNESRYSSPYSEPSPRQYGAGFGDREVTGSNWQRTRGGGEWSGDSSRGASRYGEQSGESRSNYGQSAGSYENYGQGYDDYYGRENTGRGSGQSGGSYLGSDYGSNSQGSQSTRGQSFGGQSYRGKGPKGYQRSDERIKEIVCEALMEAPHIDASEIDVDVKNREIKLTGTVNDRRTKYAAEELLESKAGGCEIRNEIRVKNSNDAQRSQSGWQSSNQSDTQYGGSQSTSTSSSMSGSSSNQSGTQSGKQDASKTESSKSSDKYGKNS